MQRLLQRLIHAGIKADMPLHEQEQIVKLNKLYLLTIPACIMGSVWSYDSIWFFAISMSVCVFMQFAIVLHHWGKYQTANIYANLVFNLLCSILAIAFSGKTGTENYLFVAIFTIQLQYHFKENYWRIILSVLVFLLFTTVKIVNFNWPDHPHLPIPSLWYIIHVQNIATIFFLFIYLIREYITLLEHYQLTIQAQNEVLANKQQELIASNQVKDQLFAIIGHDLSKPIASVKGMIMLITQKLLTPEQETKYLNQLTNLLDSTDLTLKNLLDWGLQQNKIAQRETLSIYHELVQNFELLQAIAIQKNIVLQNEVHIDAYIFADKHQFAFILRNLIANALKFTHLGGKITVFSVSEESYWKISVQDNGIGIKAEDITKLFSMENRFTTRGTAKEVGTGLGLPLCKQFIENNGGVLTIISEEGKGSIFSFTMPKSDNVSS